MPNLDSDFFFNTGLEKKTFLPYFHTTLTTPIPRLFFIIIYTFLLSHLDLFRIFVSFGYLDLLLDLLLDLFGSFGVWMAT